MESVDILSHYPQSKEAPPPRIIREEIIDKSISWGYFYGVAQENGNFVGGGFVLYIFERHSYQVKMGMQWI